MATKSRKYRTIKALVFDFVHRNQGRVDPDALAERVTRAFPWSRWKKTHWAWYKYQIAKGRYKEEFGEEERANVAKSGAKHIPLDAGVVFQPRKVLPPAGPRGPAPRDTKVKRIGDAVLSPVRFVLDLASVGDDGLRFRLNRWIYSRLLQDERRTKAPVKKLLWNSGIRHCQACGERFRTQRGLEIHRVNSNEGYSVKNCELLCRDCHQSLG